MTRRRMQHRDLNPTTKLEEWGPGPWVTEPDEVTFEYAGMQCWVRRHPQLGHFCGYVAVPCSHPLHGLHYDDMLLENIDHPHGGLTFADRWDDGPAWWFGFDCGHAGDISPFMLEYRRKDMELETLAARVFLRDDWEVYRDVQYVISHCERLAVQLAELAQLNTRSHTFCRSCKSQRGVRLVELELHRRSVYMCGRCWAYMRAERSKRHMKEMQEWAGMRRAKRALAASLANIKAQHSN